MAHRACHPTESFTLGLALTAALLAGAQPASAVTLVIRADGSGDVPTIQAGVDSLISLQADNYDYRSDTLRVEPGNYDEDVVADGPLGATIMCAQGARAAWLRSFEMTSVREIHIQGLTL